MADIGKLRNVAILSHGGVGKTSVTEALLYIAGATTRMGRVDDGNTVSDYEPEEVKRGSSIQTSLIPCDWKEHKLNFLDTPGYDDFIGEVIPALRVAEGRSHRGGRHRGRGGWDRAELESLRVRRQGPDVLHKQDGQGERRLSPLSGGDTVPFRKKVRCFPGAPRCGANIRGGGRPAYPPGGSPRRGRRRGEEGH